MSALLDGLARIVPMLERILVAAGCTRSVCATMHSAALFTGNRRRPAGLARARLRPAARLATWVRYCPSATGLVRTISSKPGRGARPRRSRRSTNCSRPRSLHGCGHGADLGAQARSGRMIMSTEARRNAVRARGQKKQHAALSPGVLQCKPFSRAAVADQPAWR